MILTMLQNKGMSKGAFLIVGFKKDFIPFDLTEFWAGGISTSHCYVYRLARREQEIKTALYVNFQTG